MAAFTDYLENKLIDQLFRAQPYTFPSTLHYGLLTAAPTDSTGGTEVTGGAYARIGVICSLANFAGTQGAGTTAASSGVSGATSNNAPITFPANTAAWGTVTHYGIWDAATAGNLMMYAPLSVAKPIGLGEAQQAFAAGVAVFQVDN